MKKIDLKKGAAWFATSKKNGQPYFFVQIIGTINDVHFKREYYCYRNFSQSYDFLGKPTNLEKNEDCNLYHDFCAVIVKDNGNKLWVVIAEDIEEGGVGEKMEMLFQPSKEFSNYPDYKSVEEEDPISKMLIDKFKKPEIPEL